MPNLDAIKKNFEDAVKKINNLGALERLEIEYLGRKGKLTGILRSLKGRNEKERKKIGKEANNFKAELESRLAKLHREIEKKSLELQLRQECIDVTAPGILHRAGGLHPLTLALREACNIFSTLGFSVADGPEVETEWHNFDALNIPPEHPAREMWDTFWIKEPRSAAASRRLSAKDRKLVAGGQHLLMRTHTSPVQIRFMQHLPTGGGPPFRIISPGKVFRHESTDAGHDIQFWQIEGLAVGREINIANFKSTIETFFGFFFTADIEVRLRPSYFPFTEPSFEVDMRRNGGDWLEIAGAGMVHPEVLRNCGIHPHQWQGFAFGMGVDRLAMLKYKIPDIRLFRENDIRFLKQFR